MRMIFILKISFPMSVTIYIHNCLISNYKHAVFRINLMLGNELLPIFTLQLVTTLRSRPTALSHNEITNNYTVHNK